MKFLPQARQDAVPTIRVLNSDLYAPHPELEVFDRNAHREAFAAFSGYLARSSAPTKATVWTRLVREMVKGFIGRWLIRWGLALGTSKEEIADEVTPLKKAVDASVS